MRRLITIALILIVAGAGGFWAYQRFFAGAEGDGPEVQTTAARRGTIVSLVNATGSILPEGQVALTFKGAGRVAEVLVREGQHVEAGDLLARLDTEELDLSAQQAEISLGIAQARLAQAQRGVAAYEIAAAQAALDSAQAAYKRLLEGPSEAQITVARANLSQAEASLEQAQAAYDRVRDRPEVAMLPQALQLEQATIAYEVAQANYTLAVEGPSAAELAAAKAQIAQAEANLSRLQTGPAMEEILIAQKQVEQASVSLEQVELSRKNAELRAPLAGTVTAVNVQAGELAGGGLPAVVLTDLSQYHTDLTVDEIDIARIQVGQPVTVTLDALPDVHLAGQVDEIAPAAQVDSGLVSYGVRVGLAPTDAPLRAGMTANVDIVVDRLDGVLLVPNRFIRIDRETGRTYVDLLVDPLTGQTQAVEIEIGARNEVESEVLAGLEEGEVVAITIESSQDRLRRAMQMGPP
jgi:HlyD family secretion protein